jgi:hypothetical protein
MEQNMKQILAILFLSRDLAHREHLRTKSYAQHIALQSFYEEIVEQADALAEMYQGRHGLIKDIPLMDDEASNDIADTLESYMKMIEDARYKAVDKADTPIQNQIDTVVGLYLTTLYKLRNLR